MDGILCDDLVTIGVELVNVPYQQFCDMESQHVTVSSISVSAGLVENGLMLDF